METQGMEVGSGAGDSCHKLGHEREGDTIGGDIITEEEDAILAALAGVVVDQLLDMKKKGINPSEIERLFGQPPPAIPIVPERKRRQHKEAE
jgi:hypothetical protein